HKNRQHLNVPHASTTRCERRNRHTGAWVTLIRAGRSSGISRAIVTIRLSVALLQQSKTAQQNQAVRTIRSARTRMRHAKKAEARGFSPGLRVNELVFLFAVAA